MDSRKFFSWFLAGAVVLGMVGMAATGQAAVVVNAGSEFTWDGISGPTGTTVVNTTGDIALAANGGTYFANSLINNGGYGAHQYRHLNDGIYGNSHSWIGAAAQSIDLGGVWGTVNTAFAGVGFVQNAIGSFAFGRANNTAAGESYNDRAAGTYYIQYTTVPSPTAATANSSWTTLGSITIGTSAGDDIRRHLFTLATPVMGTGLRIVVPNQDTCLDEIEVYAGAIIPSGRVWTGGGDAVNWSVATNWDNGTAPQNGDSITFDGSTGLTTNHNDLVNFQSGKITFASTAWNFTLAGNDIILKGDVVNSSTNTQTISLNLALSEANRTFNTTGNMMVGGVISDGGAGLGITKSGVGTLALSAANTYGGPTTINAGKLQLNNANAVQNSTVTVNAGNGLAFTTNAGAITTFNLGGLAGTGNINLADGTRAVTLNVGGNNANTTYSGILSGIGGLTKNGSGTLTLSGASGNTGATTINQGVLSVATIPNGGTAGPLGAATANAANLVLNGGTLQYTGATATTNRGFTLGAAGGTIEVATAGANLTLTGGNAGAGALAKTGTGTLTVGGGTYTMSALTVNGGVFNVAGGSLTAASLSLNGGDYAQSGGTAAISDIPAGTGSVTLNGGTLDLMNSAIDAIASLNLNAGALRNATTLVTAPNLGPAAAILVDDQSVPGPAVPITTAIPGALNRIDKGTLTVIAQNGHLGGTEKVTIGTAPAQVVGTNASASSGIIAPWIVAQPLAASSAVDFANYVPANGVVAYSGYVNQSSSGLNAQNSSSTVFNVDVALPGALTGNRQVAALKNGGQSIDLGGNTLTLAAGGLIFNGSGGTVTNGVLDFGVGEGVVYTGAADATISSAINASGGLTKFGPGNLIFSGGSLAGSLALNSAFTFANTGELAYADAISGPGSVTKTAAGTLTLSGENTYTGGTTINAGTLVVTNWTGSATGTGPVLVNRGATLQIGDGTNIGIITGSGSNNGTVVFNLPDLGGPIPVPDAMQGSGVVKQVGPGAVALTGASTYTGGTVISGSTLAIGSEGAAGAAAPLGTVPGNYTLNNVVLDGGTLAATANTTLNAFRMIGLGPTSGGTGGTGTFDVPAGMTLAYGTANAGQIASAGNTGVNHLKKTGAGTLTLAGQGAWNGATNVSQGTLNVTSAYAIPLGTVLNVGEGTNAALAWFNLPLVHGTVAGVTGGTGGTIYNTHVQWMLHTNVPAGTTHTYNGALGSFNYWGMAVSQDGPGTQIISGPVVVNGTNGIGFAANAGRLVLDYGTNNAGRKVSAGNLAGGITLGGGELNFLGAIDDWSNETATGAVTANVGASTVSATSRGDFGSMTVNLTQINPLAGGTVHFVPSTSSYINLQNVDNSSGILGGWATVANGDTTDWATNSVTGWAVTPYSSYDAAPPSSGDTPTANYLLSEANASLALDGALNANSLKIDSNTGSAQTLALGGNALTLGAGRAGGILFTGSDAYTIDGTWGGSTLGAAGAETIIHQRGTGNVSLAAPVGGATANAGSLTLSFGPNSGNVSIDVQQAYTGPTYVNGYVGTTLSGANEDPNNPNSFNGGEVVTGGNLVLNAGENTLAAGSTLVLTNGTVDLNGNNQAVAVLTANNGAIVNSGAAGAVLSPTTLNITRGGTFANDNLALVLPTLNLSLGQFLLKQDQQINALAGGTSQSQITIGEGSTLTLNLPGRPFLSTAYPGVIDGPGNLRIANNATSQIDFGSPLNYGGDTIIDAGAYLIIRNNSLAALPRGTVVTANGFFDMGNRPQEIGGLEGTGTVYSNWGTTTGILTINVPESATYNFAGNVGDQGGGVSVVPITKTGTGTQVLSGTSITTGPTTVNAGKLVVSGALPNSAVAVNGGGTLGGTGTLGQTLTVAGGSSAIAQGVIDLTDGAVGALTLNNANAGTTVLTLGGAVIGSPSVLNFDLGETESDSIRLTSGKLLVNPGGGLVNITALGTVNEGLYPLITFTAGQATRLGNLALSTTSLEGWPLSLIATDSGEFLSVGIAPAEAAYWKGGYDGDWNRRENGVNWVDAAGVELPTVPAVITAVTFVGSGAGNLDTTLGEDFSIKSLTFDDTATDSVTIGGTNKLTLAAGIVTTAGTGSHTISAEVVLGANQTWTIDGANPLTVSGPISAGAGVGLTKAGSGTLVLKGAAGYTGTTTVNAGTLLVDEGGSLLETAPLTVNTGGTLALNTDQTVGTLLGTGGTIELQNGHTLTVDQGGADTQNTGPAMDITGDGNFVKGGTQHLRLLGELTYTGATTVNGTAVLVLQGTGTKLPAGTLLTVNSPAQLDLFGNVGFQKTHEVSGLLGNGNIYSTFAPANTLKINVPADQSHAYSGNLYPTNGGDIILIKDGLGTQVLSGANTFNGGTTVTAGTLQVTRTASLPGYNTAGKVTVDTGATLAVSVGGAGEWNSGATDDIAVLLANAAFAPGALLGIDTTSTFGGSFAYSAPVAGQQGLAKLGEGSLVLDAVNTYTGGTDVREGTLEITSADALPAGGSLTIGAGGTVVLGEGLTMAAGGAGAGIPELIPTGAAAAVPEPGTVALLLAGAVLAAVAWLRRRARTAG